MWLCEVKLKGQQLTSGCCLRLTLHCATHVSRFHLNRFNSIADKKGANGLQFSQCCSSRTKMKFRYLLRKLFIVHSRQMKIVLPGEIV